MMTISSLSILLSHSLSEVNELQRVVSIEIPPHIKCNSLLFFSSEFWDEKSAKLSQVEGGSYVAMIRDSNSLPLL